MPAFRRIICSDGRLVIVGAAHVASCTLHGVLLRAAQASWDRP